MSYGKNFFLVFVSILAVSANNDECGIQNVICKNNSIYRSIDGTCNNLKHPNWGTIFSTYIRFLPPKYGDGIHSFALTQDGKPLPNVRNLTLFIYEEGLVESYEKITLNAMAYGQLLTHDLSFTLLPNTKCCTKYLTQFKKEPNGCANIKIPANDPYYTHINATCLPFQRTKTNRDIGCQENLPYAEQISNANNYLDLSIIYGHTLEVHNTLRTFANGTLLVEVRKNQEWPPSSVRADCPGLLNFEKTCYRSGDKRIIQNPQLTISHILWIREHNRIARELAKINPHWNDNKLFQIARSINIAKYQHIAYYELLPVYVGYEGLIKNKIIYQIADYMYVNDYDENQKPHVYNEFAHGAFRQFHSLIVGKLGLFSSKRYRYNDIALKDYIERPVLLEKADVFDSLIRGLALQSQMPSDIYYDSDFTRGMFIKSLRFGEDTKATDVQRSRDHGLPSYNDMREFCGLKKAKNFKQFLDVMTQDNIDKLLMFYNDPDDVELLVGGAMEKNLFGTLAGPTFLCIIYRQFYNTRKADRFWYENKNSGFTRSQLREIKKATVSKLLCDNGNNITHMQKKGFFQLSALNPLRDCNYLLGPNLKLWKEL